MYGLPSILRIVIAISCVEMHIGFWCFFKSYKNFQTEHFLKDLRNLDWSYFNHYHDLDEACKKFNENVKSVAEKHAPFVTQRISGRVEAWVTEDLIIAIRERDFL